MKEILKIKSVQRFIKVILIIFGGIYIPLQTAVIIVPEKPEGAMMILAWLLGIFAIAFTLALLVGVLWILIGLYSYIKTGELDFNDAFDDAMFDVEDKYEKIKEKFEIWSK